jgi:hypothetical protein
VWENRGVAPAYQPYQLRVRLAGPEVFEQDFASGNQRWLPQNGRTFTETYRLALPPAIKSGRYTLAFKLYSKEAGRDVLVALRKELLDKEGFYRLGELEVRP